MEKLNIVSLFSGMGAFERALNNINVPFNLIAYSEIDKYASKAYSLLHGVSEDLNLGDITKVNENEITDKEIDILTYGFPCQDISVAGEKKGFFDEDGNQTRSGLFFDALRIIRATKPKICIAENVKNLTNPKMLGLLFTVIGQLSSVGYTSTWRVLNAADFGIPQNRERVFIVSIRHDVLGEMLENDSCFMFPNPIKLTTAMSDFLQPSEDVESKYWLSPDKTESVIRHNAAHAGHIVNDPVCDTLLSRDYKDPKVIKVAADMNHYHNDQMNRLYDPSGLCPTLKTVSGGGREIKIEDVNGKYRKLTPIEYFRLMGFTDDDVYILEKNGISKTQLYKMAGNSIVVNVAMALMKNVIASLRGEKIMMPIDYPLEEQLERIDEEVKEFCLSKPTYEMDDDELAEAEDDASLYVEWVEDDEYIQLVPRVKKTGKMIYPL